MASSNWQKKKTKHATHLLIATIAKEYFSDTISLYIHTYLHVHTNICKLTHSCVCFVYCTYTGIKSKGF